jgi:alpha-L-arabinofuranosidase
MNYADLKATHAFGDDKKVVPKTSTLTATVSRNSFVYTFPAHSLTILRLRVE